MARKVLKRQSTGLFDVPGRRDEDDDIAVLGGPAGDGGLFGGPDAGNGLFDTANRGPDEMPGLFEKPARPGAAGAGLSDKPPGPAVRGLFDKPAPRRK